MGRGRNHSPNCTCSSVSGFIADVYRIPFAFRVGRVNSLTASDGTSGDFSNSESLYASWITTLGMFVCWFVCTSVCMLTRTNTVFIIAMRIPRVKRFQTISTLIK